MYGANPTGIANAVRAYRTVADPNAEYESMLDMWKRSRALCSGERFVKAMDGWLDQNSFTNLLLPFSPSMSPQQYKFYRAEAELPGIVSQFAKMLVGGLLRKQPSLTLPDDLPPEAHDWIINSFGQDDSPISAFLDLALWEELQTTRAWVYVDYPKTTLAELGAMTPDERDQIKPYPINWDAESVINWKVTTDKFGKAKLTRVIVKCYEERYSSDGTPGTPVKPEHEFHPEIVETVKVHELDSAGLYQIRVYQEDSPSTNVPVVQGRKIKGKKVAGRHFRLVETITDFLVNDKRLDCIPAWPLNGSIDVSEPYLTAIVDKEIALYNKVSRRNHLMYGAATYTPIISSDMTDDRFEEIVDQGLGSWIKLNQGDTADVLKPPTEVLKDYTEAIAATIEEMAKLGVRMLTPETDQSGVALEIRNAAQTAQLGTLNNKVSNTMAQIICFMINWRYDKTFKPSDIKFQLSSDFNPIPLGADHMRLATEWYQQGLIPRSIWLQILKVNDMLPPDYDDEDGQKEIADNTELLINKSTAEHAANIEAETALNPPQQKPVKPALKAVK